MAVTLVLATIAIGLAEGIPLARNSQWKEFAVMSALLGIAILLVAADRLGLPTPVTFLNRLLGPVGRAIFK